MAKIPPKRPVTPPPRKPAAPPPRTPVAARTQATRTPAQEPAALKSVPAHVPPGNGRALAAMDDLDQEMHKDAGLGVSLRPNDNITPSINVLQPMSPQVLAGPAQIEDARAGDFWVRGAGTPIIQGSDGIWFQPAAMTEHWFEFVPRDSGGGFVARYDVEYDTKGRIIPPDGAVQDDENPNSFSFTESGNNCIHYRFIAGIVWSDGIGLEYVIPFHGTGHTVARTWNTKWTRKRFSNGDLMPAYSHLYHLTTEQKTNKKGTWFQVMVGEGVHLRNGGDIVGDQPGDLHKALQMGRALAQAFERGEKLAGVPEDDVAQEVTEKTITGEQDEIPY